MFKFKPNLSFKYALRIQTQFTHDLLDHCTHIRVTGSGAKKIKIQNKAELTRNSAPMLASFLVNSALFCIFIFFPPEPVTLMCVVV